MMREWGFVSSSSSWSGRRRQDRLAAPTPAATCSAGAQRCLKRQVAAAHHMQTTRSCHVLFHRFGAPPRSNQPRPHNPDETAQHVLLTWPESSTDSRLSPTRCPPLAPPYAPQPKSPAATEHALLTWPESSADSRSSSTRCPPRAALTTLAPLGIQLKSSAFRMPLRQVQRMACKLNG